MLFFRELTVKESVIAKWINFWFRGRMRYQKPPSGQTRKFRRRTLLTPRGNFQSWINGLPKKRLLIVVFLEPSEARAAFEGLAYKRYKDGPLYLEWALGNILNPVPSDGNQNNGPVVGDHDANRVLLKQHAGLSDADIDPDRIEIKQHMKNGKLVSMGFGFIEFDSVETATNICQDLQIKSLRLPMKFGSHTEDLHSRNSSQNKRRGAECSQGPVQHSPLQPSSGNIASPRSFKDCLCSGLGFCGIIKSGIIPDCNFQVLERAKEGESLEELRARAAAQFTDDQNGHQNPAKLSRKRKHMAVLDEGRVKFERTQFCLFNATNGFVDRSLILVG
ncbi:hypothetical protein CRG98_018105 [Punica granatum]|uniref:RRM domain-containing protein n=1 Tax=Punica granatum TaxID=22663 RepID=A0A2I0JYX3_PUNGR|nr:hypothetical protein CRG98_018105 [Punica granatum]